jgi:hypothetical protein
VPTAVGSVDTAAAVASSITPLDDQPEDRRGLAAGLLALAALALAVGGVAARRLRRIPSDHVTAGSADEPEGPRLTLVAVPDEHGP